MDYYSKQVWHYPHPSPIVSTRAENLRYSYGDPRYNPEPGESDQTGRGDTAKVFFRAAYDEKIGDPNGQRIVRNQIIEEVMTVIDENYYVYEHQLRVKSSTFNLAADLGILGVTTAGTVVSSGTTKTVLHAIGAGLAGGRAAANKELLLDLTVQAIQIEMQKNRLMIEQRIKAKLAESTTAYSLEAARRDLTAYFHAGTVNRSLQTLSETLGLAKLQTEGRAVDLRAYKEARIAIADATGELSPAPPPLQNVTFPDKNEIPARSIFVADVTIPANSSYATGFVFPAGTRLPTGFTIPPNSILPVGSTLPTGLTLKAGTTVHKSMYPVLFATGSEPATDEVSLAADTPLTADIELEKSLWLIQGIAKTDKDITLAKSFRMAITTQQAVAIDLAASTHVEAPITLGAELKDVSLRFY